MFEKVYYYQQPLTNKKTAYLIKKSVCILRKQTSLIFEPNQTESNKQIYMVNEYGSVMKHYSTNKHEPKSGSTNMNPETKP